MNTDFLKVMTIVLMLAVAITGCDKAAETVSKMDSEITIAMSESSLRTLQLYLSTTKIYPCCNYPIDLSWKKSSNTIDISVKGVIETDICLTALGPATATIDLGALSNGTYLLNFHIGNLKRSGELIVSSDSYKMNLVDNPNFRFTNTPLNKVPENTIWGIVGYHEQGSTPLAQLFLNDLMNLGAEKKKYNTGYYTEFEIDENGEYADTGVLWGYWFHKLFIFHYSGNIADVDSLVEQYARNYNEKLSIIVNTDKGERFLSWMY